MSKKDKIKVTDRKKYNLYLSESTMDKLDIYCVVSKRKKKNIIIEELIEKFIEYCKQTGRITF